MGNPHREAIPFGQREPASPFFLIRPPMISTRETKINSMELETLMTITLGSGETYFLSRWTLTAIPPSDLVEVKATPEETGFGHWVMLNTNGSNRSSKKVMRSIGLYSFII